MSIGLDKAILEAQDEMDTAEMAEMMREGEDIDYVIGLTDHMVESEPDYTEEDIDPDVKAMVDEEV